MEPTIKKTKDYAQFKVVVGNRSIKPAHLANLTISIANDNMLSSNPIIVNEDLEVIDGQHRLEVARNNNLDIYYIVLTGARINEVVALNSVNKEWRAKDYVESYAIRGKKSYIWLLEFIQKYDISLSQSMLFLYGGDQKINLRNLRRGDFSPSEEMKTIAEDRADLFWEVRPFINKGGECPRPFLRAIIHIFDKGGTKQLLDALKKNGKSFVPATTIKGADDQLSEILESGK